MRETPAAAIAAALALASPLLASAQEAIREYRAAADDQVFIDEFNMTVGELEDTDVMTSVGEVVGEVEDVLVDAAGQPVALSVDVGGLLGLGGREVVIGLHQLRRDRAGLVSELSTEEQFEALPTWAE